MKPVLVNRLAVLLMIQAALLLVIGLSLMTHNLTFLRSWSVFVEAFQTAWHFLIGTPEVVELQETLLYDAVAFIGLILTALLSLLTGIVFFRARAFAWVLSQVDQILTLIIALAIYLIYGQVQAYFLMVIGIFMVVFLNNADIRVWFLEQQNDAERNPL